MSRTTSILTLAALLATSALTGCGYAPSTGWSQSDDVNTYISTPQLPQTVTLRDTRSSEELLVVEVPVGKQLVLAFYGTDDESTGKGLLRWGLMKAGTSYGGLTNQMDVPPASSHRIDVAFRRAPEYTRPLAQTKPAELPKGVTIADSPNAAPKGTPAPATKPVDVEVTSPKDPKVDIPE